MAQRTREIGIRIALGARRGNVVRLMIRRGLAAPALGMLAGLLIALAVTRFLGAFLADVSPFDPLTYGLVLGGLGMVAAAAIFVPTRRATRVDPAETLRAE